MILRRWKHFSLTVVFALGLLFTAFGGIFTLQPKVKAYAQTGEAGHVYFKSSFEDDELSSTPLASKGVDEKAKNFTYEVSKVINTESIVTLEGNLTGNKGDNIKSFDGSEGNGDGEGLPKFFDGDIDTKYLTRTTPSESNPAWVSFELKSPAVVKSYGIVSANDASERDPKAWKFFGSSNGSSWTLLDTQVNISYEGRFCPVFFDINNSDQFSHYKLEITQNYGSDMVQMAEVLLGNVPNNQSASISPSNLSLKAESVEFDFFRMYEENRNNVKYVYYGDPSGFSGVNALKAEGAHVWNAESPAATSHTIIYEGLNIPVTSNMEFSYVVMPYLIRYNFITAGEDGSPNSLPTRDQLYTWDLDYMSTYLALDVQFTDGTYLSDLEAVDQNRHRFGARAQGDSRALIPFNWNHIFGNIGEFAGGKTIDKILAVYDNPNNPKEKNAGVAAYFDDIYIRNKTEVDYTDGSSDGSVMKSNYVNILRTTNNAGTAYSRGSTAPTIQTPHGFNSYIPATEWASGVPYNYMDRAMYHVELCHYSSQWIGTYGTVQFMPNTSQSIDSNNLRYEYRRATYEHENEIARAHYYSVLFNEGSNASNVKMEIAPQSHSVAAKFTFDDVNTNRNVILDNVRGGGLYTPNGDKKSFSGYNDHKSGGSKRMYVYGEFDVEYSVSSESSSGVKLFSFGDKVVTMYMASSFISVEQAKKNLELEMGLGTSKLSFTQVKKLAQDEWEDKMNLIEVEGATEEQLITLYSSIYKLYSYPNFYSENTGTKANPVYKYKSPYQGDNADPVEGKLYTNNGFWDTYRTSWPAFSLFTPNHSTELLNGLVQHYNDVGWVPRWIAPGGHNMMVGTNSDIVFADAMAKGVEFDYIGAYTSALRGAAVRPGSFHNGEWSQNAQNGGREWLERYPYIGYSPQVQPMPGEHEVYQYSWAIEGYINDYAVGVMADILSKNSEYSSIRDFASEANYYSNRSLGYYNYFDMETKFLRSKNSKGEFEQSAENFNPMSWFGPYTEANAWNMTFTVPHDPIGLSNLYGGQAQFKAKLDEFFTTVDRGQTRVPSPGMIHEVTDSRDVRLGMYAHGNQPSHHIPFMYNYAGSPSDTQWITRDLLERCYVGSSIGQGYLGDEDNGEQSAWYILSAIGLYPMSLGNNEYAITSPLYSKITLNMDNGKKVVINAENNSKENVYIQSMKLNGVSYDKNVIDHNVISEGAVIDFVMGSEPSDWASGKDGATTNSPTQMDVYPNAQIDIVNDLVSGGDNINDYIAANAGQRVLRFNGSTGNVNFANSGYKSFLGTGKTADDLFKLFDNDGITSTSFGNKAAIILDLKTPVNVDMITITNTTTSSSPTALKFYGSDDGTTWEIIKDYTTSFNWNNYLKPFDVANGKTYLYFKLELEGSSNLEIAEIEFIGGYTRQKLKSIIDNYYSAGYKKQNYSNSNWRDLDVLIETASSHVSNYNSTLKNFTEMGIAIDDIVSHLRYNVSKQDLNNAIANADTFKASLDRGKADSAKLAEFDAAYANAVAVKNDSNATQAEVNEATTRLNNACEALDKKGGCGSIYIDNNLIFGFGIIVLGLLASLSFILIKKQKPLLPNN